MKLIELAQKWKNKEINEIHFKNEIKKISISKTDKLEDELDNNLLISNDGNSLIEVFEDVFDWDENLYEEFYNLIKTYRKDLNLK